MDRPLKLWEFVLGLFGMMVALCTIVYNCGMINGKTDIRLSAVEVKAENTEKKLTELQQSVDGKMDKIGSNIFDIKLLLQDKQDRKR